MKFKTWLIQLLGVITTLLSIALIYLILFKDGKLNTISTSMLIEFFVVISIAISTKFFWYTSTESSVRSSDDYLGKRTIVTTAISTTITNAKDFDDFIEIENDSNYNKYVSNKCKNITVKNYKLSPLDWVHKLFWRKPKSFYVIRYMIKIERKANKQHKLSGHNIRSLSQSADGLTDDRNKATTKKITFLWTGAVFSFLFMFLTAAIAFDDKTDIDLQYALLKMAMYVSQILFSILQAVLKARMTVETEDLAYFNKIMAILTKYEAYKTKPYKVEKISYIDMLEVQNGSIEESSESQTDVNISV